MYITSALSTNLISLKSASEELAATQLGPVYMNYILMSLIKKEIGT
jgi:hypothetical protein